MCQGCYAPCKRNLAPTLSYLHHLQRTSRAMIRWICSVTTTEQVSSQDLLEGMQLEDLAKVLCNRRLRWHGHVKRNDWLKKVQKLNPTGGTGCGHPKKTWTEAIDADCQVLALTETRPFGRKAWSGRLRSAVGLDPSLY